MEHLANPLDDAGEAVGLLAEFGLTRQEATVYLELLLNGELNGYEVAKSLGISRSNAYTALAGLTDKGAAWILEGATTRYTAVPPKEFLAARLTRFREASQKILAHLPKRREAVGGYVTIKGADNILSRLLALLGEAKKRVYLALPANILVKCLPALTSCIATGCKVVIITDSESTKSAPLADCLSHATVHISKVEADAVRVIVDSSYVLTGELCGGKDATCLYSDHKNLTHLFKQALRNEIKLIELQQA